MRRLLLLPLVAAVLLVVAPTAQSATKTVSITAAGFVPATASIQTGDTVTWTNSDTKNHQVISQDAGFASPILKPNESFSFAFKDAGRFQYSDALVKTLHGLVSVTTPPPTGAPTLVASRSSVVFGGAVRLSGKVPNEQAGEHVMLKATVLTASGLHTATVDESTTAPGGVFDFSTTPRARTTYVAVWQASDVTQTSSPSVRVLVAPRIGLGLVRKIGRLATVSTRATSAISYRGHVVWVQRRNAFGRWVALRRVVLRSNSLPTLATVRLPHGLSRLRVMMTAVQAGIGYTAGASRTMLVFVR